LKRKRGIFFQKGKNRKPYIIELQQGKKKRGKNEKKKKKNLPCLLLFKAYVDEYLCTLILALTQNKSYQHVMVKNSNTQWQKNK
jgi:hypothetical protein